MAIVNVTPDSFYDGGKYSSVSDVLRDVEEKIKQGADIIDLGAASTRPNAKEISETEEWSRLKEILKATRKNFPATFLSIDTYRASVARQVAGEGADLINDVSGGNLDKKMFETVASLNLPYILMHLEGTPQTMKDNPPYKDVISEVRSYFEKKLEKFRELNFKKIILDPGFGFGKSLQNNYELLKGQATFSQFNLPLLAGVSRKSMINQVIGTNPATALNGTTVLNTIALLNGASILRVHDVPEARQAIQIVEFYKKV